MSDRSSILWRRLDMPGHEIAELVRDRDVRVLRGTAVLVYDRMPCRMAYRIACDSAWRTREVSVDGEVGGRTLAVALTRTTDGAWHADGRPVASLSGCIDVDLGFSPSTNLLPIRRLTLSVGEHAAVRAAWVRFPTLTVEVLEQSYTRLATDRYRYESAGGAFRRDLMVSAEGWVTQYPDFWSAEAQANDD